MQKRALVLFICLMTCLSFSQPASKWQVGTIVDVKTHEASEKSGSDVVSYDVCLRVGGTIYLLEYTPPLGTNTVKYSAGRDLLVLVGENTITYNDLLGKSWAVPIIAKKPATTAKASK